MSVNMQAGMLGRKVGMLTRYDDAGRAYGATVIEFADNVVTQVRTIDRDGYSAVQIGTVGDRKRTTRAQRGHLKASGQEQVSMTVLAEFRTNETDEFDVGTSLSVDRFQSGMYVDVTARTKGRGFQGVVKRWDFAGGPKTHGQSDRWRAPGSIGAGTSPGRVFKGKKMPGHMGNRSRTVLNQLVVEVDIARGLIFVAGNVPGPNGSLVEVRQARKRSIDPVKVVVEPVVSEDVTDVSEESAVAVSEAPEAIANDEAVLETTDEQPIVNESSDTQDESVSDGEEEQS
jgi:large subunit ribosomal protein L3